MMNSASFTGNKLHRLCTCSSFKLECLGRSICFLGFWILKALKPRTPLRPRNLDLFLHLCVGSYCGEIFTSMVELQLWRSKLKKPLIAENQVNSVSNNSSAPPDPRNPFGQFELRVVTVPSMIVHVLGVTLVSAYIALVSSARDVLKQKGLNLFTFSLFTTVSTLASCGFVPTNENMIVFSKNSGLLLIIIPQVLLGNTLFPSCLRFSIWTLGKFKKVESNYLLTNTRVIGFLHLLPSLHSNSFGSYCSGLHSDTVHVVLLHGVEFRRVEWPEFLSENHRCPLPEREFKAYWRNNCGYLNSLACHLGVSRRNDVSLFQLFFLFIFLYP
ncbi:Sodium transporter HKT1 [Vitis vinifera]|uniref:Sodium transporter HKT1 n=1 Tax=Vitis vinifera TaxID=29760 RepID=A0A438JFQ1_VITVI|nr:Sodium transporter HKT1 [Vitis vinifera]